MTDSPYQTPEAGLVAARRGVEYVGFWQRVVASVIDSLLLIVIVLPVGLAVYGSAYLDSDAMVHGPFDVFLNYIFPAVAILLFWHYRAATPGKMAVGAIIVDAHTGGKPSTRQLVLRYLGYYPATLVLGVGLLWVAWDERKQGWHDKMANTVVVRPALGNGPRASFAPD